MSTVHPARSLLLAGAMALTSLPADAQQGSAGAKTLSERAAAAVSPLRFRELGPARTAGRIADLAVVESNPAVFFVGTASGGLWKTTGNGVTWQPLFDDQATSSIGDVTVAPSNPNLVWVGTGEPQNRQSSPWGNGVYKSVDGGETWAHMGLEETRHVGRIAVHPANPNVVYVAAVGHLWGPNEERGVYRTRDGGETWDRILFVDVNTGAIDLVMDPQDPETLFAAMYQRRRTGFGFAAGGGGSGLYRTTDGGDAWTELRNGLPDGEMGRIGLDLFRGDPSLVYAIVEARDGEGLYRSEDRGATWERVSDRNNRPMYYSWVRIDPNNPERIYLGGGTLSVSDDGGRSWWPGDAAAGIHVDHHALWIDPANSDHLLLGSDGGVSTSWDGARTWRFYPNMPISQFYEIGVDDADPYTVCGGLQDNDSWCGPSQTLTTYGVGNWDWQDVATGDGFYSLPDPHNPGVVFSETQGGNLIRMTLATGDYQAIRPVARPADDDEDREYRYNWNAPVVVSTHTPGTVYIGANHVLRSLDEGASWEEASPDLTKRIDRDTLTIMGFLVTDSTLSRHDGTESYGNLTALAESHFSPDVLYAGTDDGNLHVTRDGGGSWTNVIDQVPGVPERTYVSRIHPSRHEAGRVYVTFDGHRNDDYRPYAFVSEDHGASWTAVASGLPDWSVNVIREHPRDPDLLFLGNEIGVYVSVDRGRSWGRVESNLPTVPVDDIAIQEREDDLILGTHGRSLWLLEDLAPLRELDESVLAADAHLFSVRRGTQWRRAGEWPFRDDGFRADNPPDGVRLRVYRGQPVATANGGSAAANSGSAAADAGNGDSNAASEEGTEEADLQVEVSDPAGRVIRTLTVPVGTGVQEVVWDMRPEPPYELDEGEGGGLFFTPPRGPLVPPGSYSVRLAGSVESGMSREVEIRGDPRFRVAAADRAARHEALISLYDLMAPVREAGRRIRDLREGVAELEEAAEGADDVPADIQSEVDELAEELDSLSQAVGRLQGFQGVNQLSRNIEAFAGAPAADQLWLVDRAWERAGDALERLNAVITDRLPALYRRLQDEGIWPPLGDPVALPPRRGGG